MQTVTLAATRAAIARWMLGDDGAARTLGDVTLYPHQLAALRRIERLLSLEGGALLADDVGLGKTFVALAATRAFARPLVVAPAALRDAWRASAHRARCPIQFATIQSLSQAPPLPGGAAFDLVVIDEAHHLRSRETQRFRRAAQLCRGARVLLMTATPVQNRLDDLRAILSLFLGERAFALDGENLTRFIVRRIEADLPDTARPRLPHVSVAAALPRVDDADCLNGIAALPPPLPPTDGGEAGTLLTYTLVRQWASSRAALRSALKRRLARAHAMEDSLRAGRMPTSAELRAWCFAEDAQQLTFAELLVSSVSGDASRLLERVRDHATAVRALLRSLDETEDPDDRRAALLHELLAGSGGARIVAFSEYTATVEALYRRLASRRGVAMLTHDGGRVAGGRVSRRELVAQFVAGAATRPAAHERVHLLLTTDLLSEGVDLHAASVVVHLDLPWNPARLEQRVGRLRRIGGDADTVRVYVMPPPAPAERLLEIDRRLREKVRVAARSMGVAGTILPGLAAKDIESDARRTERISAIVAAWSRDATLEETDECLVTTAAATRDGALVCLRGHTDARLACVVGDSISIATTDVLATLLAMSDVEIDTDRAAAETTLDQVSAWLARREVVDVITLPQVRVAHARRAVLHRVDRIVQRAPRHTLTRLAPFMRAARAAAGATLSAGAERVLDDLALAPLDDDAWLHALREFATLHARRETVERIAALVLLRRA